MKNTLLVSAYPWISSAQHPLYLAFSTGHPLCLMQLLPNSDDKVTQWWDRHLACPPRVSGHWAGHLRRSLQWNFTKRQDALCMHEIQYFLATRFARPCRTTKADGRFRQPSWLEKSPSLSASPVCGQNSEQQDKLLMLPLLPCSPALLRT